MHRAFPSTGHLPVVNSLDASSSIDRIMWTIVSQRSILVIDDDASIRGVVRAILRRMGFEVDDVDNGREAIDRLHRNEYAAVVLDPLLADGSGEDVLRTLAEQRPNEKCILVLSGMTPAQLAEVDGVNVQVKLAKPFDIREFTDAIEKCVGLTDNV